ncbi:MAG: aminotransferase class I/II-fold pyridoxal phosphate-dependent enzyme [Pseudobdellovibrionaceae bacterium]
MSQLQKAIRFKRFKIKDGGKVKLIITNKHGDAITFNILDCSINGMRVVAETVTSQDYDWVDIGGIISNSKIIWENKEVSLGRLVLRRFQPENHEFGFSTVDIQVPVSGPLSHHFDQEFIQNDSFVDKELSSEKFSLAHFVENDYASRDLFDRVKEFSYFHAEWVKSKKYGYQNFRSNSKGSRINLKRKRKNGRVDYLLMGSNDYLGLGAHPEVIEAAKQALDVYGFGSTGSPVTTGLSDLHFELCEKLARMHLKDSALLFNSGYAANIGIISSLCAANDLIIADQLCHASIQDAMQMAKGTSRFFKHNNADHLRQVLERERSNFNGCLVITEGVFSMDGDVALLNEIFQVAREFNCRIMVDQAHCWGVIGPNGLGVCDKYNLLKDVDIIMGTFSKIAGGIGGFAVGSKEVIDWLRFFARSQMFSVSIPPSTAAAVSKAIDIFQNDKSLLYNLKLNIQHFIKGLRNLGYNIDSNHESAVVPVVIGDESIMGDMYQSLLEDGVWCVPIVYPAVSRKNCRFRFTMMATHSISDLDYVLICLEKAAMKSNFQFSSQSLEKKQAA